MKEKNNKLLLAVIFSGIFNILVIFSGIFILLFIGLTVFFTTGLLYILKKNFEKNKTKIIGDKNVIYEGFANHFMGTESVGGYLYLTEDEIVFKSHGINIQRHKLKIPINEIVSVKKALTLGLVPNGIHVITKNSIEKFVVNKRNDWIQRIEEEIINAKCK